MSSDKAKGKQASVADASIDPEHPSEDESDGGSEGADEQTTPAPSSSSSKKKKKKRSKAISKLLKSSTTNDALVETVLEKVQAEHADADPELIRSALQQLNLKDVVAGKAGLGGKNRKETGDHKFWGTQPVVQFGEQSSFEDGYIEPPRPREELRQDPYPLPKEFEWTIVDINDPAQLKEIYELLSANYVEDDDASFRFQYSAEFLRWALAPPGYHPEWHIGVRVASSKRLVAFISGVPITLQVRGKEMLASEVNFLCVIKKLRHKRLAPVLIKEVTRQCNLKGIFQALYTAGVFLPTPVSTCRYFHRSLNIPKLVDVRFTFVPRNMTLARMIRQNKLPAIPALQQNGQGLREMTEADIPGVTDLFTKYMSKYGMFPKMTGDEVKHHFLSGLGTGEKNDMGRRDKQVLWAYVVEDPETHKITDFFTFYSLPSTIMNHQKHNLLEAAYLYYYATDVAFQEGAEESGALKKRLTELVRDALIIADQAKFDVFNALTLMDNVDFLEDLKFGGGDGLLNFYLYNWRTSPLAGLEAIGDVKAGRGVGVVML